MTPITPRVEKCNDVGLYDELHPSGSPPLLAGILRCSQDWSAVPDWSSLIPAPTPTASTT